MKVVALTLAFTTLPCRLLPQGDAVSPERSPAVSAATRRSAERAVRSFEQRRLRLLPDVRSPGSTPGDVTIGGFWYAASAADDVTPPPAEPPKITEARRALLHTLDSASRVLPGDAWLRGRLVWYAIEGGDTTLAVSAARGCRDEDVPWWCNALLGLALHASRDFVQAERAFDRALAEMPDSTRCRWTDVGVLLDGDAERLVRRTPCEGRAGLDERLWWLADPLYSIDGNELRSEHFARHTFAVLHDRWRASHPHRWGSDMREMIVRYAWPVTWSRDRERERSPSQTGYSLALIGHEPKPAYDFFPHAAALESPYDASDGSWDLRRPRAATHYAHPFAAPMRQLRHQIARFRRGDSLLVVGAWNARDDTLFNRDAARVALILSMNAGHPPAAVKSDSAGARGALMLIVPNADHLASLELFADSSRAAARARSGVRALHLTSGIAVSDILLLEPGDRPLTLGEAVRRVLPDGRIGADRRATLYWEVYGLGDALMPRVTVNVSRVRASRARRLAEKLGLRDEPQTVQMEWETDAPAGRTAAGGVTIDLRDRPAGTWRVTITVSGPGGVTASTARDLVLAGR